MTVTVDLDALQASQGIQIKIADGTRVRGSAVTGEWVAGFDGIRGVELTVDVPRLVGQGSPGVMVTVQQSMDGMSPATVHSFTFMGSGSQAFTADVPDDQLRVVCTPVGGLREAVVSVTCVPLFVDPAAAPGSGTVSEITSEDESIVITNPTGPTVDLSASPGGSQPGTVVVRKSVVFAYSDLGYNSGSGFAIFDSGIALATGEEVLSIYTHKATEFKSLTGVGTDFSFYAYAENTASEQIGQSNQCGDGQADAPVSAEASNAVISSNVLADLAPDVLTCASILADCNIWGYLTGPNEALTQGQVQVVAVVGTAS